MEYRIIEKKQSNGKKYYIAQYMRYGIWQTLEENPVSIFRSAAGTQRFDSVKQAKKALRKKKREFLDTEYSHEVSQGEL